MFELGSNLDVWLGSEYAGAILLKSLNLGDGKNMIWFTNLEYFYDILLARHIRFNW